MQLDVVVNPTCASVHGLPEKPPVPLLAKLAVPAGADAVPESVSETSTVHVVDWLIATDAGEQPVTDVEVEPVAASAEPAGSAQLRAVDTATSDIATDHRARPVRGSQHKTACTTPRLIRSTITTSV